MPSGELRPSRRHPPLLALVALVALAVTLAAGAAALLAVGGTPPAGESPAQVMGLSPVPSQPAPGFTLVDQQGWTRSLRSFRGKPVALYFMDDRCTDVCPLVAQQFVEADRDLGATARRVALVGVEVNPGYTGLRWVRGFDREHGLSRLSNWHYFTGTRQALESVWRSYNISVGVDPKTGTVFHTTEIEFIGPGGNERMVAAPQAFLRHDGTGYLPAGDISRWGHGIAAQLRQLLPRR